MECVHSGCLAFCCSTLCILMYPANEEMEQETGKTENRLRTHMHPAIEK